MGLEVARMRGGPSYAASPLLEESSSFCFLGLSGPGEPDDALLLLSLPLPLVSASTSPTFEPPLTHASCASSLSWDGEACAQGRMGDMRTVFKEARMRGGFSVEASVGLWRIDSWGDLEAVGDLESDSEFDFDFFDSFDFGSEAPFELGLS